jgi:hypothetical protein
MTSFEIFNLKLPILLIFYIHRSKLEFQWPPY